MSSKSLYKYQRQIPGLYEELVAALTPDKLAALRHGLSGMTLGGWYHWRIEHDALINDFAAHTPKQCATLKKFREHWPLLQFACIQMCNEAMAVVRALNGSLFCELEMNARDAISAGSDAYVRVLLEPVEDWPFEGEPPFAD